MLKKSYDGVGVKPDRQAGPDLINFRHFFSTSKTASMFSFLEDLLLIL